MYSNLDNLFRNNIKLENNDQAHHYFDILLSYYMILCETDQSLFKFE